MITEGKSLQDIATALTAQPNIDLIDAAATGYTYYGTAPAGTATSAAAWQIQRQGVSGTLTSFLWADGNVNFDNIWDNRVALSYS